MGQLHNGVKVYLLKDGEDYVFDEETGEVTYTLALGLVKVGVLSYEHATLEGITFILGTAHRFTMVEFKLLCNDDDEEYLIVVDQGFIEEDPPVVGERQVR